MAEEAGCCGLRTKGPTAGDLGQSARDILTVYHDHQGPEQHDGFRTDPVRVPSRFRKQPERREAWGRVVCLARRIWRLMARARRTSVAPTSPPVSGWDKNATERPTACMMVTKCAGVIVVKRGPQRQLARPLAVVPQPSLTALAMPAACCSDGKRGARAGEDGGTPRTVAATYPARVGRRPAADARQHHAEPPGTRPRPSAGQGPEPPEPADLGRAGLDGHRALVWRASRIPETHSRGAKRGVIVGTKL